MAIPKPNPEILLVIFATFCFILLPQHSCGDEPDVLFKTYHVHIVSGQPEDSPDLLLVHCLSRDDDIGKKYIHPSQEYLIRFKVDFLRSTCFTCYALWGQKLNQFTAFKCSRDEGRCASGNCYWTVRPDGFYFSKNNQTWDREYQWPPKQPSSTLE